MRTVSAAFQTAIANRTVKITELYILERADGTTHRYTTHSKDIIWDVGDNVYAAIPMQRGGVTFTTNFEASKVELALENIALAISDDVNNNILERAKLTIKRIRWDASFAVDEEFIIFVGFLDVDFDRRLLNLTLRSKFANLGVQIPRFVYEESCNYNLFDDLCGLTRATYAYSGTATAGTRTTVTDANRGVVYKVAFDDGDVNNPIEIGDTISG